MQNLSYKYKGKLLEIFDKLTKFEPPLDKQKVDSYGIRYDGFSKKEKVAFNEVLKQLVAAKNAKSNIVFMDDIDYKLQESMPETALDFIKYYSELLIENGFTINYTNKKEYIIDLLIQELKEFKEEIFGLREIEIKLKLLNISLLGLTSADKKDIVKITKLVLNSYSLFGDFFFISDLKNYISNYFENALNNYYLFKIEKYLLQNGRKLRDIDKNSIEYYLKFGYIDGGYGIMEIYFEYENKVYTNWGESASNWYETEFHSIKELESYLSGTSTNSIMPLRDYGERPLNLEEAIKEIGKNIIRKRKSV